MTKVLAPTTNIMSEPDQGYIIGYILRLIIKMSVGTVEGKC